MFRAFNILLLASMSVSSISASTAFAQSGGSMTWHVSTSGQDWHPGIEWMPFRTIARAVSVARDGDTIRIHAGTHRPSRTLMTDGKSLSFVGDIDGEGDPATIIRGDSDAILFAVENHEGTVCSFSNLVLRDSEFAIWSQDLPGYDRVLSDDYAVKVTNSVFISNGMDCTGPASRIVDSSFHDQSYGVLASQRCYVDGCAFLGGLFALKCVGGCGEDDSEFEVRNSQFTDYLITPVEYYVCFAADNVFYLTESSAVFADLVISNNGENGIEADCGALIIDCRIESNGLSGVKARNSRRGSSVGCLVVNCTISDNDEYGINDTGREYTSSVIEEGVQVSDSVICGNGIAQVRGGYYDEDRYFDVWKEWNDSSWATGGHIAENYWKGSNLLVLRRCLAPVAGFLPGGPSRRNGALGSPFDR